MFLPAHVYFFIFVYIHASLASCMNLNFDFDARSSTFSACALRCYTDISIRFTLCNKETKERVYKIGKGTARGVYNQSLDG